MIRHVSPLLISFVVAVACMTTPRTASTRRDPPVVVPRETATPTVIEPELECPHGMVLVSAPPIRFCIDLYEAPNEEGVRPLVMQSAVDGEEWCSARSKRLCFEDEWTTACEGPERWLYPYGPDHEPGRCNDAKLYIGRKEDLLNLWPKLEGVREVERLWQGDPSGAREGCVSAFGVRDLLGNVEEWTRRRRQKGQFGHVLKGRFWAGERYTCQWGVYNHADQMRYYETGFRCCKDLG